MDSPSRKEDDKKKKILIERIALVIVLLHLVLSLVISDVFRWFSSPTALCQWTEIFSSWSFSLSLPTINFLVITRFCNFCHLMTCPSNLCCLHLMILNIFYSSVTSSCMFLAIHTICCIFVQSHISADSDLLFFCLFEFHWFVTIMTEWSTVILFPFYF